MTECGRTADGGQTSPIEARLCVPRDAATSPSRHIQPSRYRSRCLEHLASGDEGVHSPSARNQNEPNFWRLQMRREGKPIRQRTKRSTCHPFVKGAVQRPSQIASSRLSDFNRAQELAPGSSPPPFAGIPPACSSPRSIRRARALMNSQKNRLLNQVSGGASRR
jgi:hypothetical protein